MLFLELTGAVPAYSIPPVAILYPALRFIKILPLWKKRQYLL